MLVNTVRMVDRYVGVPFCLLLTVLRSVLRALGLERPASGPPRRIAFIKLSEQGATVLAYRSILRAVRQVGRENVFFCCFTGNREILDIMGCIPHENVLAIRDASFWPFAVDVLKTLWRMRQLQIDTTIDLELFARISAVFAYLSGAVRRVGLHRFTAEGLYRGNLMTHRVQHSPYIHVSTFYEVLFEAVGRDPEETPLVKIRAPRVLEHLPRFAPSEAERAHVQGLLPENATAVLVIHPKAVDEFLPIRQWPLDRFVTLARRLLERLPGAAVVFTGLPSETAVLDTVVQELGTRRAVNLAGKLGLRDLLTLYTLSDVLLTTDGGPAHFAVLTDVDVIVLFGPETPVLYGPASDEVRVLSAGLVCSPCLTAANYRCSPCTDAQCMKAISVEEVEEELDKCLARRARE